MAVTSQIYPPNPLIPPVGVKCKYHPTLLYHHCQEDGLINGLIGISFLLILLKHCPSYIFYCLTTDFFVPLHDH